MGEAHPNSMGFPLLGDFKEAIAEVATLGGASGDLYITIKHAPDAPASLAEGGDWPPSMAGMA